jgi:GH43 family beta-xylosidase
MMSEPLQTLKPISVDEINILTARARALPPSGDQTHVLIEDGEDPWVVSHDGVFYYSTVDRTKTKIFISRFTDLHEMKSAPLVEVWPGKMQNLPRYLEIWSPELQLVDGKWYVYFALYNDPVGTERMYVIEATSDDPQGDYEYKGMLTSTPDCWAIDGSVMTMPDGEKYFIWSGWEGEINDSQNIYISKMQNPWTLCGPRVCLSRPVYSWEKSGYPFINEGPQVLKNGERVFIIYSASGSWTDDYCLGQLTYLGGDPLNPQSWRKEKEPVFQKTDTIFAPGHCSFVQDKNEQNWIIYHARQVRAKTFSWKDDGSPDFGQPL